MFKAIKNWRKEWNLAIKYFKADDKTRNNYTKSFNKRMKPIWDKADKLAASDDYETHLKGQKMLYDSWERCMKYDRMICRVIMLEMLDDFARYLKEEWQKVKTT